MKKVLLLFLPVFLVAYGCFDRCDFRVCDEPDFDAINALIFTFDPNKFSTDEIDSAMVVRYLKGSNFQVSTADTFRYHDQFEQGNYLMSISDPAPFSSGGMINLNSYETYDYIFFANSPSVQYKITEIDVSGEFYDCDCLYRNTKKTFKLNGQAMDRTGSNLQVVLD